jgi:outer membrane receptor for ferrienterochelin and colicins
MSSVSRWYAAVRQLSLVLAVLVSTPVVAWAQSGRITGSVADAQQLRPVHGAQVVVGGTRFGALTDAAGQFVITGVPAGTYDPRISFLGYQEVVRAGVLVQAGQDTRVEVRLEGTPIQIGGVVVSASRQAQRLTDAPATITRIGADVIDNTVGNNFAGALKGAVGLDFIQVGVNSVAINARGFNSSFNNRMLMIEDGRVSVLPESGLPAGAFTTMPKIDLEGIEVLVGPGAALYGADASSGVLTLSSKDPRQYPGTTVEVTGGSRDYRNVQARHAGVFGDWGYKITGEYHAAEDWQNEMFYTANRLPERGVNGPVDWTNQVTRGQGSLVRYQGESRFEVSGGMSQTDGLGQTNVGRNQFVGWQYNFMQARATLPNWFFQAYRTQSQSGESYALNRFTEFRASPAHSSRSDREIQDMSGWPSDGRLYAVEAQNNFRVPALLNTRVVWGGQYRQDVVSSDRRWLSDRLSGDDITVGQYGVYAQLETPITPWLDVVLASRYDDHENYKAQFSPKAGVVVKPGRDQAVRLTYNRAFKSPTILQTNFYIPDFVPGVGVFGNRDGFEIRRADGTVVNTFDALVPERNESWELGYKGVLASRLFLDVTGYAATYENFMSPLSFVSFPALGTFAYQNGQRLVDGGGNAPIALTYFNLGTAKLRGIDAGVNYFVTPTINLRGTYSAIQLRSMEGVDIRDLVGQPDTARIREASTLNAPSDKWTVSANFNEIGHILGGAFFGGLTMRHVNSYFFVSGINKGTIPTFTTLDLNAGYRIPRFDNLLVNVGVSNLYTCRAEDPNAPSADGRCGFDKRHVEMINMPSLGTMITIGARYHLQ